MPLISSWFMKRLACEAIITVYLRLIHVIMKICVKVLWVLINSDCKWRILSKDVLKD